MSERPKVHNGRDWNGAYKPVQEDFDDVVADPRGADLIAGDLRMGGAVADDGPDAGRRADELQRRIDENRDCVEKFRHPDAGPSGH